MGRAARSEQNVVPHEHGGIGACPYFVAAMDIIGRRWSALVVEAIGQGNTGFADISRYIGTVGDSMLARRLRELESDELVVREVLEERPIRVRYDLTVRGRELLPILHQIVAWAHAHDVADGSPEAAATPDLGDLR